MASDGASDDVNNAPLFCRIIHLENGLAALLVSEHNTSRKLRVEGSVLYHRYCWLCTWAIALIGLRVCACV